MEIWVLKEEKFKNLKGNDTDNGYEDIENKIERKDKDLSQKKKISLISH